ncbi:hypothetical protein, partial [Pseudomonas sp. SWRI51]|uniref:hypothetical protein n=1 Tax=Pseudomonas sp. SWRI51 TaxID=2745491 RepID=UPI001EE235DC
GLLRSPFATQGRSYTIKSDLPETIESPTKTAHKHTIERLPGFLWLAIACDEAGAGLDIADVYAGLYSARPATH